MTTTFNFPPQVPNPSVPVQTQADQAVFFGKCNECYQIDLFAGQLKSD